MSEWGANFDFRVDQRVRSILDPIPADVIEQLRANYEATRPHLPPHDSESVQYLPGPVVDDYGGRIVQAFGWYLKVDGH